MNSIRNYHIFLIFFPLIFHFPSKAQDYYIYGKTQPKLKTLTEIAEHYQVDVLEMLEYSSFKSENMSHKYFKFEQKVEAILDKTINYNSTEQVGLEWHKVKKMFMYQYIYRFPLKKGDSLALPIPCKEINLITRQKYFPKFDKLFPEISVPQKVVFSYDSAVKVSVNIQHQTFIPTQLSDSIGCDIGNAVPRFKFKLNEEVTAYFVMTNLAYPFEGHLYLFRNSDKKLYFEKGFLVYHFYEPSPGPSVHDTNTKIKDYDGDGDLDILICKTDVHYSEPVFEIEKSLKVLLWDNKNNDFIERDEYSSQETTKYFLGDNYSQKTVYSQKTTSFHPEASYSEEEILKILGNSPE